MESGHTFLRFFSEPFPYEHTTFSKIGETFRLLNVKLAICQIFGTRGKDAAKLGANTDTNHTCMIFFISLCIVHSLED